MAEKEQTTIDSTTENDAPLGIEWLQDAKADMEDYLEEQGIYIRQ